MRHVALGRLVTPVVALVLSGLVTTVGCNWHGEPLATRPLAAVKATVAKVERLSVPQEVELYGAVEASQLTAVSSRVMAAVTRVLVKVGDEVGKGQTVVEIDPQTARGQEAQARGALAQAQAALALAERNHERFRALAASKSASELELDIARMQHEQALGAVAQAQGAVDAAASVARESTVAAPFAGRVAAKLVEVGDLAAPGRPLVMLESGQGRNLVVAVPESVALGGVLARGTAVPVRIDAVPAVQTATVAEVTPGADPAAHTFLVKLAIEGADVPSGLTGRARLRMGVRPALALPAAALVSTGSVPMVVVRDAEGRARSRAVTVGPRLPDGRVEVLSGVAADEEVALGLTSVPVDGSPLEVQP